MAASVMVGAPIRNHAWVLPMYAKWLRQQSLEFETCFILDRCSDNSEDILLENKFNVVKYSEDGSVSFPNMYLMKNKLIDEFLKSECDTLILVDPRVILDSIDLLSTLVEDDKDIVSMLIRYRPRVDSFNILSKNAETGLYEYVMPNFRSGLIKVDAVATVYAIKRSVIEAGVKYGPNIQGEDIYFCEQAAVKGFEVYCDTNLCPMYVYDKNREGDLMWIYA